MDILLSLNLKMQYWMGLLFADIAKSVLVVAKLAIDHNNDNLAVHTEYIDYTLGSSIEMEIGSSSNMAAQDNSEHRIYNIEMFVASPQPQFLNRILSH